MSGLRRLTGSRESRLAWGAVSVLLAGWLVLSLALGGNAIQSSQNAAADRAAQFARSTLSNALTTEDVQNPIAGEREKQILLLVEDEVLSDERVARVRIWSTAGILIFSTHPRDREGTAASGNEQLGASMTGQVVSDVAEPRSPSDGLAGSGDAMLETFVPLRLTDRAGVAGVVEIDQHYPAITRTARWLWRSLQAVTAALLLGALALLVLSLRTTRVWAAGARPRTARRRDPSVGEIRRLKAALAERQAALDVARKEAGARSASTKEAEGRASRAEGRVKELEADRGRLTEELQLALAQAAEATTASGAADRRVAELEAHVRELEQQRNEALLGSERGRHLVAGIQAELAAASRRAEDAEQRVRELENEVPPPSDLPSAIAEVHVDEVVLEDTPVVQLPTEDASAVEAPFEGAPDEDASAREFPLEPAPPSVPEEEGLSLRTRLARAAAARHRIGAGTEGQEEAPPSD